MATARTRLILPQPTATGVAIPVDHFSGHGFVWDVSIPFWLSWARYKQTQAEDRLVSRLAAELGYIRDQQKAGHTPEMTVQDVVEGITSAWDGMSSTSVPARQPELQGRPVRAERLHSLQPEHGGPRTRPADRGTAASIQPGSLCLCRGSDSTVFRERGRQRLARILRTDARSLAVMNGSTNGDTSAYLAACDQWTCRSRSTASKISATGLEPRT